MQTSAISGAPNTAASSGTTTDTSKAFDNEGLGREAFLKLLVTQLQHQDPTAPQADTQFVAQLATFSQLEQLTQMNQSLTEIAAFYAAMGGVPTGSNSSSTDASTSSGAKTGANNSTNTPAI